MPVANLSRDCQGPSKFLERKVRTAESEPYDTDRYTHRSGCCVLPVSGGRPLPVDRPAPPSGPRGWAQGAGARATSLLATGAATLTGGERDRPGPGGRVRIKGGERARGGARGGERGRTGPDQGARISVSGTAPPGATGARGKGGSGYPTGPRAGAPVAMNQGPERESPDRGSPIGASCAVRSGGPGTGKPPRILRSGGASL